MHYFDIIVIGSGISGLNFALRAAEQKKRVLIITKKRVAQGSTNFAQGGIAAVLSKLDDYKKHVKDTLTAGCYHNNRKAVQYMVRHGPAAIKRLIELGVPFATQHGKLLLTREGGHSERRIAFVSDFTGQAIEKILVGKTRKNPRITLYEHAFAADLLVKDRVCRGVQVLRNGKFENIFADLTVLATGGAGEIFANTTNPAIATGDGIALSHRAGARLMDLEFVQFHPTALKLNGKPCFLISEAVRGEGAYLKNARGERFMLKKHKLAELAPRDIVARAIFEEISRRGPVFLDIRHEKTAVIKTRFPMISETLKKYGIDMTKDLIPIAPAAHYLCGGVKVNLHGETNIKNLCAFGETAGTGVHGANRLASNSLLEAVVFSDTILRTPLRRGIRPHFSVPTYAPLSKSERNKVLKIRHALKRAMQENVGIVRSKKSLEQALKDIGRLEQKTAAVKKHNREICELRNMLTAGRLIAEAALKREKSLGCHYRTD